MNTTAATCVFYLSEIPWVKANDQEYQNKKTFDLVGKDLRLQVRLNLKYKSIEYHIFYLNRKLKNK